jgi:hypothetical protein
LEKGYTRKSTENRVTRCRNMFWGNLKVSRCFTKRIIWGEFKFGVFWWFGRGFTEEGGQLVLLFVLLGNFCVN